MVLSAKRVGQGLLGLRFYRSQTFAGTRTLGSLIFLISVIFAFDPLFRTYHHYVWALIISSALLSPVHEDCLSASFAFSLQSLMYPQFIVPAYTQFNLTVVQLVQDHL